MLIPVCWITSVLIYAASPRQQIDRQTQHAILTPSTAWASFCAINLACFIWLTLSGWSMLVAAVSLLLLNMLMVPTSIIILAHLPESLRRTTFSIVCLSVLVQFIVQGHSHVA